MQLSTGQQKSTKDGFELHMGTNYLGPFLLSMMLLPALERSGKVYRLSPVCLHTTYHQAAASLQDLNSFKHTGLA